MSMILTLTRVSASDIARLTTPEAVNSFLASVRPRRPELDAAREARIKALAAQGIQVPAPPAPPEAFGFDTYASSEFFNGQKMWHALHFLLTGHSDEGALPQGSLLVAGTPLPGDLGYGPAVAISAEETAAFSQYLDGLSRDEFLDRLDLEAMETNDIYPNIWDEERADLQAEIGAYFDHLRSYCRQCADQGLGMIRAIS